MFDIKAFRISKGITQTELANLLNVTKSMISQVESGKIAVPELWESKLKLTNVNSNIAMEPQEPYIKIKKPADQKYLDIIEQLVSSNKSLARSVEMMADNINKITQMKVAQKEREFA